MKSLIGIAFVVTILTFAFLPLEQYASQNTASAERNFEGTVINLKGSDVLMERPYFSISLESDLCMGFVLLNGQLLHAVEMETVKFDLPVNHWIKKGDNELMMLLAPVDEQGEMGKFNKSTRCSMTLRVRPSGSGLAANVTIAALQFDAKGTTGIEGNTAAGRLDSKKEFALAKNGDVVIGKAKRETFQGMGALVTRTVTLPEIGLPEWKFSKSDNITDLSGPDIDGRLDEETSARLKKELLLIYRKIWSALKAGTVEKILPLFDERSIETDAAFFKKPGETASRLAKELKDRASDSSIKLFPITDDNVLLLVSDNNKLVRLSQNDRKALLCFSDSANGVGYYYDVIFRKSGNKWIITR